MSSPVIIETFMTATSARSCEGRLAGPRIVGEAAVVAIAGALVEAVRALERDGAGQAGLELIAASRNRERQEATAARHQTARRRRAGAAGVILAAGLRSGIGTAGFLT